MMLGIAIATVAGKAGRADAQRCGKRTPEPFNDVIVITVREKTQSLVIVFRSVS